MRTGDAVAASERGRSRMARPASRAGRRPATRARQRGYTYLLVLFLVAGLGLVAAETGVVWQHATQREREADLLAIGAEFARAIGSYRKASPDRALPETLQQLVEDRRGPAPVRHLRRVYRDPLTGEATWGLEKAGGRIAGVFSLAPGTPIRRHDLPDELADAKGEVERYSDWVFRPVEGDTEALPGGSPGAIAASAPAHR